MIIIDIAMIVPTIPPSLPSPSSLVITLILSCPVVTAYGVEIMQLLGPSSSSDCLARLSCYNALKELIATEVANT
jgi:hypothetical protein